MKNISLIVRYSVRLLTREWKRYVLTFLSLFLTALVVSSAWVLTSSGQVFLSDKQKEFLGGDIGIESSYPFLPNQIETLVGGTKNVISFENNFFATTQHEKNSVATSIRVVDDNFPLYGSFLMSTGEYVLPSDNEILIDENLAKKIKATIGSTVTFNSKPYTVIGIWKREPDALSSSQFFPKALLSQEGFMRSGLDPSLLRAEYTARIQFAEENKEVQERIIQYSKQQGFQTRIAGVSSSRFESGLGTVSTFLVIAVLLSCVLAAVNIYASMMYLLTILRRSFAVLLALGLTKRNLLATLFLAPLYLVFLSSFLGIVASVEIFKFVQAQVLMSQSIQLPDASIMNAFLITFVLTFATMVASYIPSMRSALAMSPRALLLGIEEEKQKKVLLNTILVTLSTLVPLMFIASVLLADIVKGMLVVLGITVFYVILAGIFLVSLGTIYRHRARFTFFFRTIISEKKADGFFGLVSFTSLFVALVSLTTLALLQASLSLFLVRDVGRTIPPTYVIDVQNSQKNSLQENFPDVVLFPNIGARIIAIDGVAIQEALTRGDKTVSRELGREYNLTYRTSLLDTEKIVSGKNEIGKPGEISLEKEFGDRIGAGLGSQFVFSIQGFQVSGVVTSIRETESRSGLPFFFFVLSPEDVSRFPTTFFGYSNQKGEYQTQLNNFLAERMPNVSLINTGEVSTLAPSVVGVLLLLIFVITVPPLVLATLLVATLTISSYTSRKRDGSRIIILGATKKFIERLYLFESLSVIIIAGLLSYSLGIISTHIVAVTVLELPEAVWFNKEVAFIFLGLLGIITIVAMTLSRTDTRTIRETLIYEENE